jgi:hypothetical protein
MSFCALRASILVKTEFYRERLKIYFDCERLRPLLAALSGKNGSSTMNSIASGPFSPSALIAMNSLVLVRKAIFKGPLLAEAHLQHIFQENIRMRLFHAIYNIDDLFYLAILGKATDVKTK